MYEFCRLRRNEGYVACADAVTILPSKSLVPQGFFEGIFAWAKHLYSNAAFNPANGYTSSEPQLLYSKTVNDSIYGGDLPMVKNENKNFAYTTHRIGGTTYKVKVVFNEGAAETMEDKILRIIQNETVTNGGTCDIMKEPQMSRQSGRSA